jgi:hypothetical protein
MEAGDGSGFSLQVEAVFGFLLRHLLGRQSLPLLPLVRGPSFLFTFSNSSFIYFVFLFENTFY